MGSSHFCYLIRGCCRNIRFSAPNTFSGLARAGKLQILLQCSLSPWGKVNTQNSISRNEKFKQLLPIFSPPSSQQEVPYLYKILIGGGVISDWRFFSPVLASDWWILTNFNGPQNFSMYSVQLWFNWLSGKKITDAKYKYTRLFTYFF
jgi:hypothetical protein